MKVGDHFTAAYDIELKTNDRALDHSQIRLRRGERVDVIEILTEGEHDDCYYPAAILRICSTGVTCNIYTIANERVERGRIFLPVPPLVLLAECAEEEA